MSIAYNTATINDRLTAVINNIDAGSSNGILVLGTAGMAATLASVVLAKPCGTVAGGVLTFTTPVSNTISATGTMAAAIITDSAGTTVASGLTVGTSTGYDIVASTLAIVSGSVLTLLSATITGT